MDGKSNISGLNKQVSSFDAMQDAPAAKAKKAGASAVAQAVAGPSSPNEASKPSSSIFAEVSKKLCSLSLRSGWSAKNPVVVMNNKKEFTLLADKMFANIEKNIPKNHKSNEPHGFQMGNMLTTQPMSMESLSCRLNIPPTALDAKEILEPLTSEYKNDDIFEGEEGLAYNIDGNPVGLAWCCVFHPVSPELEGQYIQEEAEYIISRLVADPWTRGAGTTVIEAAVNRSVELGCSGKVALCPASDEAQAQYERLGFVSKGEYGELELNPSTSDKWLKGDDGQYYYSSKATDTKASDDIKPSYFTSLNALKT